MGRRFAASLALVLSLPACQVDQGTIGQGSVAPAFDAVTFDGRPISFPELLDGKPAIVVFWATWCSYCKAFMPYLEDIEAAYGERVNVLTINAKEDGSSDPAAYVEDLDFPMIAVSEGDAIAAAYDVEYIPGLMIVDAEGTVAYRRAWTDLPAGDQVARLWSIQVRQGLDQLFD
ncbi:MAG TPA: TlpA disulfide reductase family protein [Gammaproteobacteria bacterium]|nr:TlpA disulfide reductase family protein [Gammaproteobacteria bacterium]